LLIIAIASVAMFLILFRCIVAFPGGVAMLLLIVLAFVAVLTVFLMTAMWLLQMRMCGAMMLLRVFSRMGVRMVQLMRPLALGIVCGFMRLAAPMAALMCNGFARRTRARTFAELTEHFLRSHRCGFACADSGEFVIAVERDDLRASGCFRALLRMQRVQFGFCDLRRMHFCRL